MPQTTSFSIAFARLLWLLVHRPDGADEHKHVLRDLMPDARESGFTLQHSDLNDVLARQENGSESAHWLSELVMRMASHSVRALQFLAPARAADVLGVARALAADSVRGDEGRAFDARMIALAPTSVTARIGPEGFVRHATPPAGMRPFIGTSSRTPTFGSRQIAAAPGHAQPSAGAPPEPLVGRYTALRPTDPTAVHAPTAAGRVRETMRDESGPMVTNEMTREGNRPASLDVLLARLAGPLDAATAARVLDELMRTIEDQVREEHWETVGHLFGLVVQREAQTEEGGDLRRIFIITVRRLMKPALLRGIAQLLPRRRDLRDSLVTIFQRTDEDGAEALVDLLVNSESSTDRRAYRWALAQCKAAAPSLLHLLGDQRWYVVRNAADLLGEMMITEADSKLIATLRHKDERVRRSAAATLGRFGTPRANAALQRMIGDESPSVRVQAVIGIASSLDPKSVGVLCRALDTEEDVDVQLAIISSLGSIATEDAVDRLIKAAEAPGLVRRRPAAYRIAAATALHEAGSHAAMSAVRTLLGDRDREVRAAAERLLGGRSTPGR